MGPPPPSPQHHQTRQDPLRLGFAGLGWIGRNRMQALLDSGVAEAAAIFDPQDAACREALPLAPAAACVTSFEQLLEQNLDGVVIATPSALHAGQSWAALQRGLAVFCQKPLARTAHETRWVVNAARDLDRLLGVDLSYRHTAAFGGAVDVARRGELGRIYAIDLTFHNAYGPDKAWFRDPSLSGGGCLIDLGVHLLDLAMLALPGDAVASAEGCLYSGGHLLEMDPAVVEDFASTQLRTQGEAVIRLTCSWNLHAGKDAVIEASFYGTEGGALVRNINGSFYDFEAVLARGTSRRTIASPPDAWGGRAAVSWARQLADGSGFDPAIEHLIDVAAALDLIYGRSGKAQPARERQPA
jgi:predicted dehydrogenase